MMMRASPSSRRHIMRLRARIGRKAKMTSALMTLAVEDRWPLTPMAVAIKAGRAARNQGRGVSTRSQGAAWHGLAARRSLKRVTVADTTGAADDWLHKRHVRLSGTGVRSRDYRVSDRPPGMRIQHERDHDLREPELHLRRLHLRELRVQ